MAKKNDINGKLPKGYLYILLIFFAFCLLCGLFSKCTHSDDEEISPAVENVSHKSDQKGSRTVNHKRKAESNSQVAESSKQRNFQIEEEELPSEVEELPSGEEVLPSGEEVLPSGEEVLPNKIEEDTSVEEISPSAQPDSQPSTEDVEVDAEISPTE